MPVSVTGKPYLMLASAVLAALLGSGTARAEQSPPVSAVSQYVEQVPTSEGSAAVGAAKPKRKALPPAARKALAKRPAATSAPLTEIATSTAYGAPTTPLPQSTREPTVKAKPTVKPKPTPKRPVPSPARGAPVVLDPPQERGSIQGALGSAAAASLGSGSNARLLGLVAFLSLTTAAMAGVAARERRASRISGSSRPG
jgi:hypothetical protein